MSDPHRVTILAKSFSAAALEFHRGKMAERGYRLEGRIDSARFEMLDDQGDRDPLFEGEPLFSVTFVKEDGLRGG